MKLKMRSFAGVVSAATLFLFAGVPEALARSDRDNDKGKNPIYRAAERANQKAAERQPAPQPARQAEAPRPAPQAAPQPARQPAREPARETARAQGDSSRQSSVQRALEASRASQERAAQERASSRQSAPAPAPSRTTGSDSGSAPTPKPAPQPTPQPNRGSDRSSSGSDATPPVLRQPSREAGGAPGSPQGGKSGSLPLEASTPPTRDVVKRTGPVRTAEIVERNRAANPGLEHRSDESRDHRSNDQHNDRPRTPSGYGLEGRPSSSQRDFDRVAYDHDAWRGGGHRDDRHDDWRDSRRNDWHDNWRGDRYDSHWGSSFSIGLGFSSGGFSLGLGYSTGWNHWGRWNTCDEPWGWRPVRAWDPCDDWRWRPCRTERWCDTTYISSRWCEPSVVYVYDDCYKPWRSCCDSFWTCGVHASWCSAACVELVTPAPIYINSTPVVIASEVRPTWVEAPAPTTVVINTRSPAPATATVYRADARAGVVGAMEWSAVPSRIVDSVLSADWPQRASAAGEFLGRTPAGAWQVVFDRQQRQGSVVVASCHGVTTSQRGIAPDVTLILSQELSARPGEAITVTGVLSEVSVDDPGHPGGVLTLEDARVAR